MDSFIDYIHVAMHSAKDIVRENAAEALGSCLAMVSEREPARRERWYEEGAVVASSM